MKITALFILLPATILARPVEKARDSSIQLNRRFTCPPNVQDFCSASNIRSSCNNGQFTSGAMDTCKDCRC
ncbi:hypothetical protein Trco_007067 [Trichoderma cornu-damae]|uniref:SSCRP protein n=1 Tax=Trichoderma cornu-damae TaxID=654480 RepID=A0A9P8QG14_9HYPO|nr:hypothetical protein Trco_007067 [Trichoderma cornu-damae]